MKAGGRHIDFEPTNQLDTVKVITYVKIRQDVA